MADTEEYFGENPPFTGQMSSNGQAYPPQEDDDMLVNETDVLVLDDGDDGVSEGYDAEYGRGYSGEDGMSDGEQEEKELSPGGVLDEDTVGTGLSNLGRSADGTVQVFLHLTLAGMSLKDISILTEYEHLQKVEIPYNEITDLQPLSNMPFLLELDASHNSLSTLLDFQPPKNLKTVDLSCNNITEMTDLSAHHYLSKLILDHNQISEIKGLEKCQRLQHFSIGHNKVGHIDGLQGLPLKELNLTHNDIKKIENLEQLVYLQRIDLSGNKIRSMEGLNEHQFLEAIDLEANEVIDMVELDHVKSLRMLRELNLQRNPIRELPDYRLSVLHHLPKLTDLDRRRVDVQEKVAATNMFNPPLEVIAARDHVMHVVYSFLQPSRIYDSTLPSLETPYPMLVLVGPTGAGKKDLALKLAEEFPDYFGYGLCHTTQAPSPTESADTQHYQHISLDQFEHDIKMGKFVLTYAHQGELYGLQMDAVEAVAREGLACVVHMELEGVLTLKNTYFEPRYVLILPQARPSHERRLRERDMYSDNQIESSLDRAAMYAEYNREHPGFFDMMINSDDITEAYRRLRRLVMDYLGISADTPSVSDFDTGPTESNLGLDKEHTQDTIANSATLARTWSKHSLSESLSAALAKAKSNSPMPTTGTGIVASESMKRRQSAAREAVSGHVPSIYDQITRETPRTVPAPVSAQLGLGEATSAPATSGGNYRAFSAPVAGHDNMDVLPPNSPDSSDAGSNDDDSLSNISEAREIGGHDASPTGSARLGESGRGVGPPGDNMLPETLDRLELGSRSEKNSAPNSVPNAPRPGSRTSQRFGSAEGSRSGSAMSGRPGSERHPVLPPIGATSPRHVEALPGY